jgi:hypothetical protein
MTSALARKFALRVSPYIAGVLPGAVTAWTPYKGITDFSKKVDATLVDVSDYDSNGFSSSEKTMQTWSAVAKCRRPITAGVYDPGQEIVRSAELNFGDQARVFVNWYDRNGGESRSGVSLVGWEQTKTGVTDVEEVTATFTGDGQLFDISNPYQAAVIPTIQSVSPSGASAGTSVAITGSGFIGTVSSTGVKFGGTNAASFSVISDALIVAVLPAGSSGSAVVTVTNGAGTSANFPYTRGS